MRESASPAGSLRTAIPPGATFAVIILTAMNLLNYIDRYVPSAVKELFKEDLKLTDAETSYPLTAFVVVYMLVSPIFGSLADRWSRKALIAAGVALWSIATGAAAFATGFWTFLIARALVGVGEAAYATIAPALMSDFYPAERRNRILTIFYVAIPVGAALGFTLGGMLGDKYGWRPAFMIVGFPGLLAAGLCLFIRDPGRGRFDPPESKAAASWPDALRQLSRNQEYIIAVAGYTAVTFAAGGMADWFPAFLSRYRGMTVGEAGSAVGTATVLGGLIGTVAGGILADKLRGRTRHPYLALSAVSMIPATLFAVAALFAEGKTAIVACIFFAQLFLWFYNGPINAILVNCVSAGMRARAFSLSILSIHILGDAISPPIIGIISDRTGNLLNGIILVPITMFLGVLIWAHGWRRLPEKAAA